MAFHQCACVCILKIQTIIWLKIKVHHTAWKESFLPQVLESSEAITWKSSSSLCKQVTRQPSGQIYSLSLQKWLWDMWERLIISVTVDTVFYSVCCSKKGFYSVVYVLFSTESTPHTLVNITYCALIPPPPHPIMTTYDKHILVLKYIFEVLSRLYFPGHCDNTVWERA